MSVIGIELGPTHIRAIRVKRWPQRSTRVFDASWDGEHVTDAVAAIRAELGTARAVAVAIDLALLHAKHVKLPPLSLAERRRILALEPDRYFPVRGESLVIALHGEGDLVFAAAEPSLSRWIAALEELGPVQRVEAACVSLARSLGHAHVQDAIVLLDDAPGRNVVEIRNGKVHGVRRIYGELADAVAALSAASSSLQLYLAPWSDERAATVGAMLSRVARPVPPDCSAATGVTLELGRDNESETLAPPQLRHRIQQSRRTRTALAGGWAALALLFTLVSFDANLGREQRQLDGRIADVNREAARVLALQKQLADLDQLATTVNSLETKRLDPLQVLYRIGEILPEDAHLRGVRGVQNEWQLDGYARNAARLVRLFEEDPQFEGVRFLGATTRTRVDNATYENFSIALRLVSAP